MKNGNEFKLTECLVSGHYLFPDPDYPLLTDIDNITHIHTKCKRCNVQRILHLDNKKSL